MSIARQASEITLPAVNDGWQTVLQFLCSQFPFIAEQTWRERIVQHKVHWFEGEAITEQTPFMPSRRLCYYREVVSEPVIPFEHHILYQDEHILVADKPHFLPVTPGGEYVNECLLARLKRQTGIDDLVPVHRLDRETAGLVLFSVTPESRAQLYQLFSAGTVLKTYKAAARLTQDIQNSPFPQHWHIENRIEKAQPRFINAIVPGAVNAVSDITLSAQYNGIGEFTLRPHSGKTHQLRLHMQSLGMPILHDKYYPRLLAKTALQFDNPLQLLAAELRFIHPLTQVEQQFYSTFSLNALRPMNKKLL
ncbi:pseudouridine synthase [Rheinheimera baltica]|uniref:Pseudouridine synthase n=1 Tax=Rheinheimera baltica TaxID=67576 RepID=A0ABT9HZ70_9GAMM|nr:pseudouridine synthase [Rheinheimera baltica]MDP5136430.1 pseudouridine synthase [Rheinheimera baltica]MDP5151700.1 pseudouridine synthase [Rheinheimera baltica]MDP5190758.1 pseudouridine synthase [Rheinheimera baltica]